MNDALPSAALGTAPGRPRAAPPPIWLLALMTALGPLSTDLYLPALPAIGIAFDAGPAAVQWTLSGFLFGFAPAMLFWGPLADRFGRRPVILAGGGVFLLGSVLCALAPTLPALVAARVLQAVGACAGPVLSRSIVRDTVAPARIGAVFATIGGVMALAPSVGPILGGVVLQFAGWRGCFWVLALGGLLLLLLLARTLRETAPSLDPHATRFASLLAAAGEFAGNRSYRLNTIVASGAYSALFSFISGGTYVIQQGLGLSPTGFALCFGAVAFAYFCGSMVSRQVAVRLGPGRMVLLGAAFASAVALTGLAALLWFGPSLTTVVAPPVLIMIGFAFTQPNAMAGAVTPFPHMAGRASAALGFVQWGTAALSGLVLAAVLDLDGVAIAFFTAFWTLVSLAAAVRLQARGKAA
jgi:DHA1 family bicyclomycin/chloramphenicol resistance-like MFS transporter